jgi:hypothetical protein
MIGEMYSIENYTRRNSSPWEAETAIHNIVEDAVKQSALRVFIVESIMDRGFSLDISDLYDVFFGEIVRNYNHV